MFSSLHTQAASAHAHAATPASARTHVYMYLEHKCTLPCIHLRSCLTPPPSKSHTHTHTPNTDTCKLKPRAPVSAHIRTCIRTCFYQHAHARAGGTHSRVCHMPCRTCQGHCTSTCNMRAGSPLSLKQRQWQWQLCRRAYRAAAHPCLQCHSLSTAAPGPGRVPHPPEAPQRVVAQGLFNLPLRARAPGLLRQAAGVPPGAAVRVHSCTFAHQPGSVVATTGAVCASGR